MFDTIFDVLGSAGVAPESTLLFLHSSKMRDPQTQKQVRNKVFLDALSSGYVNIYTACQDSKTLKMVEGDRKAKKPPMENILVFVPVTHKGRILYRIHSLYEVKGVVHHVPASEIPSDYPNRDHALSDDGFIYLRELPLPDGFDQGLIKKPGQNWHQYCMGWENKPSRFFIYK